MTDLGQYIDVFDMLDKLDIDRVHAASGGTEANFSCPFSGHAHGDEKPSAYMNVETTAWFCWGCKERGKNAISFVMKVLGVTYETAARFLREAYGVDFAEPKGGSMAAETEARFTPPAAPVQLRRPNVSWLNEFKIAFHGDVGKKAREYALGRGFSMVTLERWEVGYSPLDDRLTLPVRDLLGDLVGFKGRALDDERDNKYMVLGDRNRPRYGFDPYEAAEVVFGLHRNKWCEQVVLCEGELDALALAQAGIPRPVALGMSYLTDFHARLIIEEAKEVIVFFDTDPAGEGGIWGKEGSAGQLPGLVQKLEAHVPIRLVQSHEGDPASMPAQRALQLIWDAHGTVASQTPFG
jgi:DNA primase